MIIRRPNRDFFDRLSLIVYCVNYAICSYPDGECVGGERHATWQALDGTGRAYWRSTASAALCPEPWPAQSSTLYARRRHVSVHTTRRTQCRCQQSRGWIHLPRFLLTFARRNLLRTLPISRFFFSYICSAWFPCNINAHNVHNGTDTTQ